MEKFKFDESLMSRSRRYKRWLPKSIDQKLRKLFAYLKVVKKEKHIKFGKFSSQLTVDERTVVLFKEGRIKNKKDYLESKKSQTEIVSVALDASKNKTVSFSEDFDLMKNWDKGDTVLFYDLGNGDWLIKKIELKPSDFAKYQKKLKNLYRVRIWSYFLLDRVFSRLQDIIFLLRFGYWEGFYGVKEKDENDKA